MARFKAIADVCARSTRSEYDLAEEACVDHRTLRKWIAGKRGPDGVVKLLSWAVALDELVALEEKDPLQLDAVLGGSFTVEAVREYMNKVFDEYDPEVSRYDGPPADGFPERDKD